MRVLVAIVMVRITIQMACGCADQAQPMDIMVDTVGGLMMWDGLGPEVAARLKDMGGEE